MTTDDKIRDEKIQYDISSSKNVTIYIFTNSPLGKALEKLTTGIKGKGEKQIKVIEDSGKQLVECTELIEKKILISTERCTT